MKRISMTKEWNEKDLEKMEPSEIAATLNFYRSRVIALQRDARLESLLGKEPKYVYSVFSDWGSYDDWGRTLEKVFSATLLFTKIAMDAFWSSLPMP